MKTRTFKFALLTFFKFALLAVFSLYLFTRCQQEVEEIIEPPNDQVITGDSIVANLVQRTALRDGSSDNIVDGSSCTSLELPISVVVNGLEMVLDSEDDFFTVEHIVDKFDNDEDYIEIIFPVKVILADHSVLELNNEDDLANLIAECTENSVDDDIECVDFKFPLSISIYNSDNQVSDVITLNEDSELYQFIHNLKETDFASINFPITLVVAEGDEMVIHNNDELEDALINAIDACDEDDDNDHNDDDVDDSELINVLIDGHWEISEHVMNSVSNTAGFAGYIFTFFEDGRAKALKGDSFIEGKWDSNGDDGTLELELDFGANSPFNNLQRNWDILEFDGNVIRLKYFTEESDVIEYLTFERPEGDGIVPDEIIKIIADGSWMVALFNVADDNVTDLFNDYILTFSSNTSVIATRGDEVVQGSWSIMENDQGIHKLLFDFGAAHPLNELNNDWQIIEVNEGRIELKDVSGIDGSIAKLVFERPVEVPPSISTVIVEGSWIVANYDNANTDETAVYNDMIFNFSANQSVIVTIGNDRVEGSWSVMTNNEGVEKLLLDFGDLAPLNHFNNDWEIIDVKEARIELKDVSGIDGSISKLVFERLL